MLAAMVTGTLNITCCQPEAVSLVNVAVASSPPSLLQRWPTCVPVFRLLLKKRIPAICASTSLRKLTPSSAGFGSCVSGTVGTAESGHSVVQGQTLAAPSGNATSIACA